MQQTEATTETARKQDKTQTSKNPTTRINYNGKGKIASIENAGAREELNRSGKLPKLESPGKLRQDYMPNVKKAQ